MQLLSGGNYDIDIDDLKNNTRYSGGYNEGSRTIKIFWEVLEPLYYRDSHTEPAMHNKLN